MSKHTQGNLLSHHPSHGQLFFFFRRLALTDEITHTQGHLLSHHPSHGSKPMFCESPLHTALRALVIEHLLLPTKEAVGKMGQAQQLPWLTGAALAKPIKNCEAVFKVRARRRSESRAGSRNPKDNEEAGSALTPFAPAADVVACANPSVTLQRTPERCSPRWQGEMEDLMKKLKKCNDAKKSLQELV
jgi:hypothetical protein